MSSCLETSVLWSVTGHESASTYIFIISDLHKESPFVNKCYPHSVLLEFVLRVMEKRAVPRAKMMNSPPSVALCSTEVRSITTPPTNEPKAIPKWRAELFRLC